MERLANNQPSQLNRSQVIIILICLLSNLAFTLTAIKYIKTQTIGLGGFTVPNTLLKVGHFKFYTYTLVDAHMLISAIVLVTMAVQIILRQYQWVNTHTHRAIGYLILLLSIVFFIIGEVIAIIAMKTPFNQLMYVALPWFFIFTIITAITSIRRKQLRLHHSLITQSIVILCSAAIYRCLFIIAQLILSRLGKSPTSIFNLTPYNQPIDGIAIITYVVLIVLCWVALSNKKSWTGHVAPVALLLTLLYGMIFVPWKFFGLTDISRVLDSPAFLLKNFIHEVL